MRSSCAISSSSSKRFCKVSRAATSGSGLERQVLASKHPSHWIAALESDLPQMIRRWLRELAMDERNLPQVFEATSILNRLPPGSSSLPLASIRELIGQLVALDDHWKPKVARKAFSLFADAQFLRPRSSRAVMEKIRSKRIGHWPANG